MGCSSMCSISTLLKRISSIERMIDIDDCLTMFILCQFASMDIRFFSRPLSVWCLDNVFSSSVCVFSLYSPYSSFRTFSQLLERGRDHFRPTQEERWRRPLSRFVSKTAPIYHLSSVISSSSSSSIGYVSRPPTGVGKDSPAVEFRAPSSSSSYFR